LTNLSLDAARIELNVSHSDEKRDAELDFIHKCLCKGALLKEIKISIPGTVADLELSRVIETLRPTRLAKKIRDCGYNQLSPEDRGYTSR
jgi:hypothetical protein